MNYQVLHGDCLEQLKTLPDESIQCCVTSPPYYGLRDYGCEGQIGLEATPEAYVEKLVDVFREVKRVLKDDGTLWLNLGDSYAGSGKGANPDGTPHPATLTGKQGTNKGTVTGINKPQKASSIGLKSKDLIGIPWMVAFALRSDGWYLRQDIIWAKPNPMPESVTDRCTKSHEYIFLLTKSARYYYDAAAIKEPCVYAEPFEERCERAQENHKAMPTAMKNGIRPRKKTPQTFGGAKARNNEILEGDPRFRNGSEQWGRVYETTGTRNKRSVWSVTTQPYKEAHFATFPEEIPRTCILAGSKKGDTILDPFSGAGTTGVVAEKLNRKYIGIELNPQYTKMSEDRIYNVQPLFAGLEL